MVGSGRITRPVTCLSVVVFQDISHDPMLFVVDVGYHAQNTDVCSVLATVHNILPKNRMPVVSATIPSQAWREHARTQVLTTLHNIVA